MIYLISLYMGPSQNKVHFGLTFIVFSQNGSGQSQHFPVKASYHNEQEQEFI